MAASAENYSFPPHIAGAVVSVMRSLGTLAKDQENKFDKYDYASIDDFIAHVRGHCAEAGLAIIPDEGAEPQLIDVTKKDGKPMVVWKSRFGFILIHEKGESFGPIFKTVAVQFNGAQAAGSAQSYAMKQLFRGLFLIKTGDKDDPDEKGLDISSRGEQQTDLQKVAGAIRKKMRAASDLAELGIVWSEAELDLEMIRGASVTAFEFLEKEYRQRKTELENA